MVPRHRRIPVVGLTTCAANIRWNVTWDEGTIYAGCKSGPSRTAGLLHDSPTWRVLIGLVR